jgi:hypothetical protein
VRAWEQRLELRQPLRKIVRVKTVEWEGKTANVLSILLLSVGGKDAVDDVVDDGHFCILGTMSLYLTFHQEVHLQTPARSSSISTSY